MKQLILILSLFVFYSCMASNKLKTNEKPRILISTDIGGTDPDDNQSMAHFLMYSNMFQTEGLVSSPSFGFGKKQNILDMIALYEKDYPKLKKHLSDYPTPDELRAVVKQGRHGSLPFSGYAQPTEGSEWIIKCAMKKSKQPLWVLVWGGLEDLAQALHDAPQIKNRIRVYSIGGPNKKWGSNSYAYIAANFPDLWMIEANASYRGFFSNTNVPDSLHGNKYFINYLNGAGYLGNDFKKYYNGNVKMGDTPSLLYLLKGNPNNPLGESWGGSFEKFTHSPRFIFTRNTTTADTVSIYSIIEYHFDGPKIKVHPDSSCFIMSVGGQDWPGFYLGNGKYAVRYSPKQSETLTYVISSDIPGFKEQKGQFVVNNIWPGKQNAGDFKLGKNWYTEPSDPELYQDNWQGAKTVSKWRSEVLLDWGKRLKWLKEN